MGMARRKGADVKVICIAQDLVAVHSWEFNPYPPVANSKQSSVSREASLNCAVDEVGQKDQCSLERL